MRGILALIHSGIIPFSETENGREQRLMNGLYPLHKSIKCEEALHRHIFYP